MHNVPCLAEYLEWSDRTALCGYGHYFQQDKSDLICYRKDEAQVKMDKLVQNKRPSCLRICPQQQPTVNV